VIFPLTAAAVFTLATLLPAILVGLLLTALRRRPRRWWRTTWWLHAGLFPLHLFATFPLFLGWYGSRHLHTRPDERAYAGPPAASTQRVESTDGVTLRVFRLPAREPKPVAAVVLVHGLFRSAKELEPVAAMFRDLGCECWLVELRNHGGSGRAPFTAGLGESDDVVAAVQHVRAQQGRARTPVVLWGVSIGTVAVSMALPRLDGIAGVVLDCPIDDLHGAAHRMLSFHRADDRRSFFRMFEPWRSLTIASLGWWSGFRVEDVSPGDVLATLPHDLPVLVVGAGLDDRAPPDTVRRLFDRLPMPERQKELWIDAAAEHGRVFLESPAEYSERLARLLARLRGS
jgi:alpha-beta hydrolase superfamily lysophospholipase